MTVLMKEPSSPTSSRRWRTRRPRPRRPLRQHRPRQRLRHRRPDRHQDCGLPAHRGGLRRGHRAEKFFNIKCRYSGLRPDAAVIVATIRAQTAARANTASCRAAPCPTRCSRRRTRTTSAMARPTCASRSRTCASMASAPWSASTTSRRTSDSEVEAVFEIAKEMGVRCARSDHWAEGSGQRRPGAPSSRPPRSRPTSSSSMSWSSRSRPDRGDCPRDLRRGRSSTGEGRLTDPPVREERLRQPAHLHGEDPPESDRRSRRQGAPSGFTFPIARCASVGAGFIYPLAGEMRTMPGLPPPAAENVDIDF